MLSFIIYSVYSKNDDNSMNEKKKEKKTEQENSNISLKAFLKKSKNKTSAVKSYMCTS